MALLAALINSTSTYFMLGFCARLINLIKKTPNYYVLKNIKIYLYIAVD